jgi:hypothetical protein
MSAPFAEWETAPLGGRKALTAINEERNEF